MIGDFFAREGGYVLSWWLLTTLAGAAVLPLFWRLLGGLPDRGVLLARAGGLLLTGFTFWLLGSFGLLNNSAGSIMLAWLIVLAVGLVVFFTRREPFDLAAWWRQHRVGFLVSELLFIMLLVGWALVRAHNPDTSSTEKPMDLMFMSSILRSESFPPNDAWMAGYAISYYYFGYLIAAMLGTLSGLSSTLTYSMMIVLLVGLTAQMAYGVVYNLVRTRSPNARFSAISAGLLGVFFVVLMGNFQAALIEIPYQTRSASEAYLAFWDSQERTSYPERETARLQGVPDSEPVTLIPNDMLDPAGGGRLWLWWFRASRVIQDRDLSGQPIGIQPIDEFPQFSFLLADSHPHVMVLPFVLLALGLALNLLRTPPTRAHLILYAICIGGLVFFNTWDGPIYAAVLIGADYLRRMRSSPRPVVETAAFGAAVVGLGLLFYLPFLIGFRSQASGILPNWEFPTLFRQYFIMFGPFLLILVPYLLLEVYRGRRTFNLGGGLLAMIAIFGGLVILMVALSALLEAFAPTAANPLFDQPLAVLGRRLSHIVTTLVLLTGLGLIVGRLFPRAGVSAEEAYPASTGFALLIIAAGLALTLVPDYIYLRDVFSVRINTVFKFYYAAWVLLSVGSAYAVYSVISDLDAETPGLFRPIVGAAALVAITLGAVYPVLGIHYRAQQETGRLLAAAPAPLTLDGGPRFIGGDDGDDYAAIQCMAERVQGADVVIVEAVEGSYNPAWGRVGALTGLPVLINWPGHQSQWRGSTYPEIAGTRQPDIDTLYTSQTWDTVQLIIERYGIDYIFFGSSERNKYSPAAETKFLDRLPSVCQFGDSRFYIAQPTTASIP